MKLLVENQILVESMFKNVKSFGDLLDKVSNLAIRGLLTASLIANICMYYKLDEKQTEQVKAVAEQSQDTQVKKDTQKTDTNQGVGEDWTLVCNKAIATVYNAVPSQCNKDCGHTASMFRLNLSNVASHRIIAIERSMMQKYNLKMGDVVYLDGVGKYNGVWQVQDKMNKRFAGLDKIDLLVPNNVKHGQWENVKIYVLKDKSQTKEYKSQLAPQLSKAAFNAQFKKKA